VTRDPKTTSSLSACPPNVLITFKAKLHAPMTGKGWTFATLPASASAKLPGRGRISIRGTINGFAFRTSAFPDGKGSHTIQINAVMRQGAKAQAGDTATFRIEPDATPVKVTMPADLRKALSANPNAKATWDKITPKARAEWVTHIQEAKQEATRQRRIARAIQRLAAGTRRFYE
jgi:hypothetical protein